MFRGVKYFLTRRYYQLIIGYQKRYDQHKGSKKFLTFFGAGDASEREAQEGEQNEI